MFIAHFSERPYQDPRSTFFGAAGRESGTTDLSLSNRNYDPSLGADLYHRYLDEKVYAEEMGFDGFMLNEHHSSPFCMGNVMNVEAAILARITKRAKIILLGNVLPIWDDPIWLAEELAEIDIISRGRLVSGWVRGTGRESVAHNSPAPYNWERFQEAHDLILKAWTTPGPFRWEGQHYQYRYVNPWPVPYQKPHPPIWIPGILSKNTVAWAAQHRYPYVIMATELEPTKKSFDYYDHCAREAGFEAGSQHHGYLTRLHVDETEELAEATAKKYMLGPPNPFLAGNQGRIASYIQALPGMTSHTNLLPGQLDFAVAVSRGIEQRFHQAQTGGPRPQENLDFSGTFAEQVDKLTIIHGTPTTVLPKLRYMLERTRPGAICFWDGDGSMTHDDTMRSLRLMGQEVIPALREIATELDLPGPFEVDPATNQPFPTDDGA